MAKRAVVEFEKKLTEILPEGSTKIRGRIVAVRGSVIAENLKFSTKQGDLQVVVGVNEMPVLLKEDGTRVAYDPTESSMSQRTREIINGRGLVARLGMSWNRFRSSFSLRELAGDALDEFLDEPLMFLVGGPILFAIIVALVGLGVPLAFILLAMVALESGEAVGSMVNLGEGHNATWGDRWSQLGSLDLSHFWGVIIGAVLLALITLVVCGRIANRRLLRSITVDQKAMNNFVLGKLDYSAWPYCDGVRFNVSPEGRGDMLAVAKRTEYVLP